MSFNIPKSTLINFRLNTFLDISLILPGISFHNLAPKIGTACLSFSRLNFLTDILFFEDHLVLCARIDDVCENKLTILEGAVLV